MNELIDKIEELQDLASINYLERRAAADESIELYQEAESLEVYRIRIATDALLVQLGMVGHGNNIKEPNDENSYQVNLLCSFIQTHYCINNLILESHLVEAVTLIRKQLEALTRLNELDKKSVSKVQGKTPNIQNQLGQSYVDVYRPLSEVAHFSTPRVNELLSFDEFPDGEWGPSVFQYYHEKSHQYYLVHWSLTCKFVYWFLGKVGEWYDQISVENEKELFAPVSYTHLKLPTKA